MDATDEALVVIALLLGIVDAVAAHGPWPLRLTLRLTRVRLAGVAVVLLAITELRRAGVLGF